MTYASCFFVKFCVPGLYPLRGDGGRGEGHNDEIYLFCVGYLVIFGFEEAGSSP